MVSAVVVRSIALLLGLFSSWPCTSGPVSHRLDSITRLTPLISGASVPNIWPATPWMPPGIGLRLEPRQRRAHAADGAVLRRHRRMAGGGVERQEEGAVALLGQADQRRRLAQARQHAVEHQQAFVEHPVEAHAARLEQLGDRQRAAQAADLLVVAHHEIDRLLGLEAAADQQLDGFHLREQVALVVERAAAPDEAVLDLAAEGVDRPGLLGARRDRHHVLVRHQRDRAWRAGSLPGQV